MMMGLCVGVHKEKQTLADRDPLRMVFQNPHGLSKGIDIDI
jgi:hypothetical protein